MIETYNTKTLDAFPPWHVSSVINAKLRSRVRSKALLYVYARSLAATFHYAGEYDACLFDFVNTSPDVQSPFLFLIHLRQIALDLKRSTSSMVDAYLSLRDELTNMQPSDAEALSRESSDSKFAREFNEASRLLELHHQFQILIQVRFRNAGCSSNTSFHLVDDCIDLWSELIRFRYFVSKVCIEIDKMDEIQEIIHFLMLVWRDEVWHAAYHLGDYQNNLLGLYNPGVLGWSLVALTELSSLGAP